MFAAEHLPRRRLNIDLDLDLNLALKDLAKRKQMSLAVFCREALRNVASKSRRRRLSSAADTRVHSNEERTNSHGGHEQTNSRLREQISYGDAGF